MATQQGTTAAPELDTLAQDLAYAHVEAPSAAPDAVPSTEMVKGWAKHKTEISDPDQRCGTTNRDACPACRASKSCPLDVLYTVVARAAALCGEPELTKQTVKYELFSAPGKKDPTESWDLVGKLLAHRTTDTTYAAVQLWSERLDHFVAAQSRREQGIPPDRKPRMVRPRDRVHPNPYRAYG